jgi:hypothetical protein
VGTYQVSAVVYDTVLEEPIAQTFDLTNTAKSSPGSPVAVPADSPLALLGLSLAMIAFVRRRTRR